MDIENIIQLIRTCNIKQVREQLESDERQMPERVYHLKCFYENAVQRQKANE